MSVSGIFRLGRVSIMLQIWHLYFMLFFTGRGWYCGDSFLDDHMFNIGMLSTCCLYTQRVVLLNTCMAAACCSSASIL